MPGQFQDRWKEEDQPDFDDKKMGSSGMEEKSEEEVRFKSVFAACSRLLSQQLHHVVLKDEHVRRGLYVGMDKVFP